MTIRPASCLVMPVLVLIAGGFARSQVESRRIDGDAAFDNFGISVALTPDLNGDGYADILVGAPMHDGNGNESGVARVFSASGRLLHSFHGGAAADWFGGSVAGIGDVDGDGYGDLAVGAIGDDVGGSNSGSVRVLSGRTGTILHSLRGFGAGDYFGGAIAGAGDVDQDGRGDLIVGASRNGTAGSNAGAAYVFSGRSGALLHSFYGASADDYFGVSVAGGSDVDGDGRPDLVVGSDREDRNGAQVGAARVYSGASGALVLSFFGDAVDDRFGRTVALLADVDGDGHSDIAVGAPLADNNWFDAGLVRQYSGRTGMLIRGLEGDGAFLHFGESLADAGDIDGDSFSDLVVGSGVSSAGGVESGAIQLVSGRTGLTLFSWFGDAPRISLGRSVAGGLDLDGDAIPEVVVGAPFDDRRGPDAGSIRILSAAQVVYAYSGPTSGSNLGYSVAVVGDLDGDDCDDFIAGEPGLLGSSLLPASVAVWSGRTGALLQRFYGAQNLGYAVSAVGDADGDGHADWIVSRYAGGQSFLVSGAGGYVLHLISYAGALGPVGDIDRDGYDDVIIGDWRQGVVVVVSGRRGGIVHQLSDPATAQGSMFGFSVHGAGDVDADGVPDVIVGSPGEGSSGSQGTGAARVYSGRTGSLIHHFAGTRLNGRFGSSVCAAGDLDGDGYSDVLVGAPGVEMSYAGGTSVRAFSGGNGGLLREWVSPGPELRFGLRLSWVGDVNGDGIADHATIVADNSWNFSFPQIWSGKDGALIFGGAWMPLADAIAGGDLDGDGRSELLSGFTNQYYTNNGDVAAYRFGFGSSHAKSLYYGSSCSGSNGHLPRIEIFGRAALGTAPQVRLWAAMPSSAAILMLGLRQSVPLDGIGMSGCTQLASAGMLLPFVISAEGAATTPPIPIAFEYSLLGASIACQWLCFDLAANGAGLTASNGLLMTVGM